MEALQREETVIASATLRPQHLHLVLNKQQLDSWPCWLEAVVLRESKSKTRVPATSSLDHLRLNNHAHLAAQALLLLACAGLLVVEHLHPNPTAAARRAPA